MSAPCYIAPEGAFPAEAGSLIHLSGPEGHHAATVRRTKIGERLDLVNGTGGRLTCQVSALGKAELELTVRDCSQEPEPAPHITLVQALAKGGRDEQAVETSTEFGVASIIPWQAERSIANWRNKEAKGRARWQSTAQAAAKQSRRAWIPQVHQPVSSRQFASMLAPEISAGAAAAVCHEEGTQLLASTWGPREAQRVFVVVGPEGGISPNELDLFKEAGATICLLGSHVLRSATAGPYAIATLMALCARGPLN